jgi:hypothetical protein
VICTINPEQATGRHKYHICKTDTKAQNTVVGPQHVLPRLIGPSCSNVFGFTGRLIMAGHVGYKGQNSSLSGQSREDKNLLPLLTIEFIDHEAHSPVTLSTTLCKIINKYT